MRLLVAFIIFTATLLSTCSIVIAEVNTDNIEIIRLPEPDINVTEVPGKNYIYFNNSLILHFSCIRSPNICELRKHIREYIHEMNDTRKILEYIRETLRSIPHDEYNRILMNTSDILNRAGVKYYGIIPGYVGGRWKVYIGLPPDLLATSDLEFIRNLVIQGFMGTSFECKVIDVGFFEVFSSMGSDVMEPLAEKFNYSRIIQLLGEKGIKVNAIGWSRNDYFGAFHVEMYIENNTDVIDEEVAVDLVKAIRDMIGYEVPLAIGISTGRVGLRTQWSDVDSGQLIKQFPGRTNSASLMDSSRMFLVLINVAVFALVVMGIWYFGTNRSKVNTWYQ